MGAGMIGGGVRLRPIRLRLTNRSWASLKNELITLSHVTEQLNGDFVVREKPYCVVHLSHHPVRLAAVVRSDPTPT